MTTGQQWAAVATQDRSCNDDVGALVVGAADGDRRAWEQLVTGYSALVASITAAHRLTDLESARVRVAVWHRLSRNLGKIRQPDRVATWLGAVARDECVKALGAAGRPRARDTTAAVA
jgi:hypothetical protein